MTISIVLKLGDGLVLGADSASTLSIGTQIVNSYFNAEKVFNLVKGLPIGAVTAGVGGLGGRSIVSLSKDLRQRLSDTGNTDWYLDPKTYTMREVADRVKRFFFDDLYAKQFANIPPTEQHPPMGFLVAGYSHDARSAEVWTVENAPDGGCTVRCDVPAGNQYGLSWRGMPEALNRLVRGYSTAVYKGLVDSGIDEANVQQFLGRLPVEQLIHDAMPLQDGIDLVRYLIKVTAGFVRFAPGAPTVHPPIDLAAITCHEGYRWVKRKHYFTKQLNRPIDRHQLTIGRER